MSLPEKFLALVGVAIATVLIAKFVWPIILKKTFGSLNSISTKIDDAVVGEPSSVDKKIQEILSLSTSEADARFEKLCAKHASPGTADSEVLTLSQDVPELAGFFQNYRALDFGDGVRIIGADLVRAVSSGEDQLLIFGETDDEECYLGAKASSNAIFRIEMDSSDHVFKIEDDCESLAKLALLQQAMRLESEVT